MKQTWANSGLDLHVDLGSTRAREPLERQLRQAVQSGQLAAGSLLPPSRALAADLGLARNTVAEAYAQLVAEGWLTARQGSGTRVAAQTVVPPAAPSSKAGPRSSPPYDLRAGWPDVATFPRTEWLAAARSALGQAPASAFGYGDPQGQPVLRSALAAYLARARGVRVRAENVIVCAGFTQALWLLATALRLEGVGAIGVEAYGHRRHRDVLAGSGLHVVGLPVDDQGAGPVGLGGLGAVLLTPAHQFPLGVALSAGRRAQFTQWATGHGAVVIEDDYDGEFRYDRRALGAMQALAPNHVVYAGTASKTLAPGLRLAWLVVPPHLLAGVSQAQALTGATAAALDQLTLAEFIGSGRYDRHVRRSRLAYRQRRDQLVTTVGRRFPDLRVQGLPAGLHAVLELPAGTGEADMTSRAAARGLGVDGLSTFALGPGTRPPALVVGYGTPPAHSYTTALARLCATLAEPPSLQAGPGPRGSASMNA